MICVVFITRKGIFERGEKFTLIEGFLFLEEMFDLFESRRILIEMKFSFLSVSLIAYDVFFVFLFVTSCCTGMLTFEIVKTIFK